MNFIFLNNDFCELNDASISVDDRGLLLGDGLFETIRIFNGKTPFLKKHWDRLSMSAKTLEIHFDLGFQELEEIALNLIQKNKFEKKEGIIRITLTRGCGARGLNFGEKSKPTFFIRIFPDEMDSRKIYSAKISAFVRNEKSILSRIKSLSYLENIMARDEAQKGGFDEAILLNTQGRISEAAAANIFCIKNKILYTPSIEEGALPGITREQVLNLGEKIGLKAKEQPIDLEHFLSCDEIFLTNSVIGIAEVGKINQHIFPKNSKSQITQSLKEAYKKNIKS